MIGQIFQWNPKIYIKIEILSPRAIKKVDRDPPKSWPQCWQFWTLDDLCISPEDKEQMIKEVEQLRRSIIYSSSHLHFFWQHDTLTSNVRDQVYDLWDMIGNNYYVPTQCAGTGCQAKKMNSTRTVQIID